MIFSLSESRGGHLRRLTGKGGTTLGFPPGLSDACCKRRASKSKQIANGRFCLFVFCWSCVGRSLEIAWVTTMGTELDKTAQKHCCPFKPLHTFQQDRCNVN